MPEVGSRWEEWSDYPGKQEVTNDFGEQKWLIVAGIKRWWKVRLQGKVGLDRRFPITWCRVLACLV